MKNVRAAAAALTAASPADVQYGALSAGRTEDVRTSSVGRPSANAM